MALFGSVPVFSSLVADRGEDFEVHWPLTDAAGLEFDPTGATARAELRRDVHSTATPLATFTTDPGGGLTFADDATGKMGVKLSRTAAVTTAWAFPGGSFDVKVTKSGLVEYPISGTIRVRTKSSRS